MMKNIVYLVAIILLGACSDEELSSTGGIEHEWQWVMTTFESRAMPVSAEDSDTTYVYHFKKDHTLVLRDVNKQVVHEYQYEIVSGNPFNEIVIQELDLSWGYSLSNDTLRLWEPASLYPETKIFKKD